MLREIWESKKRERERKEQENKRERKELENKREKEIKRRSMFNIATATCCCCLHKKRKLKIYREISKVFLLNKYGLMKKRKAKATQTEIKIW